MTTRRRPSSLSRWLLAVGLFIASVSAAACSCSFDQRTLERRIDDAERVLLVRVVAAALEGERPGEADLEAAFENERVAYRLRSEETLKGGEGEPPRLQGLAGFGGGDCTEHLPVGARLILFVEPGDEELGFNLCGRPFEQIILFPEVDLRLPAARAYIRDRTPIDDCENAPRRPYRDHLYEPDSECERLFEAHFEQWRNAMDEAEEAGSED